MSVKPVPASLLCDFYKLFHREQYPDHTEMVYSNWTPRANKHHPSTDKVVVFGAQGFCKKYLIDYFNDNFFNRPLEDVVAEYSRMIKYALGVAVPYTEHIEALHELGYMPLKIRCLPEGTSVPLRVPMFTVENTDPRFFWLTNFIETLLSTESWPASTSATIAKEYRTILDYYAKESGGDLGFVQFQGHDFSMRGMGCVEVAATSGSGHLLSFVGTDTIPAICYLENYYNANIENELVGTSIPATEHSVMCAGGNGDGEFNTYKRLITEVYPHGFVSIVSDTWDLWECMDNIIEPLKSEIMARDGRVVIRPDSGDPVRIICGYSLDEVTVNKDGQFVEIKTGKILRGSEVDGLILRLWNIFGGTINEKGYGQLDSHIGAIYGDSITLSRAREICERLMAKGFASTNIVLGIGSYTYQFNTRDSFGFALKSTLCVVDGEERQIFKNPATDDGTKKSNIGIVAVVENDEGEYECFDGLSIGHDHADDMRDIFLNSQMMVDDSLAQIRARMVQ